MWKDLDAFCNWLAQTPFSLQVQTHEWIVPVLQTVHILAIAIVASSVLAVDLRLAGFTSRDQTLRQAAGRFLPFVWWSLPVLLVTGAILISAEPARSLKNPAFAVKIGLLLVAILLTAGLQASLKNDPFFWDKTSPRRIGAKFVALLSLAIWIGIILAGRWIAYIQVD